MNANEPPKLTPKLINFPSIPLGICVRPPFGGKPLVVLLLWLLHGTVTFDGFDFAVCADIFGAESKNNEHIHANTNVFIYDIFNEIIPLL
jgi:hypothetical protein